MALVGAVIEQVEQSLVLETLAHESCIGGSERCDLVENLTVHELFPSLLNLKL